MKKYKLPPLKEKEIKKCVRDWLKYKRIFHWNVWQGQFSRKGISDIIAIINGKIICIEIKTIQGRQSTYQKEFQKEVEGAGGIYFLARSVDDVIKKLGR